MNISFKNELDEEEIIRHEKEVFKLFDFFANCEYFEEKFDYDEKLKLPKPKKGGGEGGGGGVDIDKYTSFRPDPLVDFKRTANRLRRDED